MVGKIHILVVFWLVAVATLQVKAESVFIISNHTGSQVQAYSTSGGQVTLQDTVSITHHGNGAVGIAVWPENELMFVTYENSPMIVWASTKTLEKVGEFDTDKNNLSGIVVDEGEIYAIQRETRDLYIYSFDKTNNTLISPRHIELTIPEPEVRFIGYGLSLDTTNGWLYATYSTIPGQPDRYYVEVWRTSDWGHDHYIPISVNGVYFTPVGISVDSARGYLYTGNWNNHTFLVRTNTTSPYTSTEIDVGSQVIGIDVDESTGLVYCTTYYNDFRVYDSSLVLMGTPKTQGISGPAGVAVGGNYKPKVFNLSKTDGDVNCISPDELLNYTIQYSANGYADTSVVITDYLPIEEDFVSCSGGGTYDGVNHTVGWNIGNISGQGSGSLQLQVRINERANPGGSITNVVKMEGANYRGEATEETNICCWGGEIIYVDKDATGYNTGTSWDNAYADLQDALTCARNCPEKTAIWIAAGTYKPTTNPDDYLATFNLVDGVAIYGHFGGIGTYETSIAQRVFANEGNKTILDGQIGLQPGESVTYVLTATSLSDVVIDGVTIRGSLAAGLYASNSNIRVANCIIRDNNLSGIYCIAEEQCSLNVESCEFIGNTREGLFCHRYTAVINNNTMFEGEDRGQHGITAEQSSVELMGCTLQNHTSDSFYADLTDVVLEQCSVINNLFGFSCEDSNPIIIDSLIKDNKKGGLWCINFSHIELIRSTVSTNGLNGIYLQDGQSTKIIDNLLYDNGENNDPVHGCGIYIQSQIGTLLIRNNTIYGNNKHGIYFESGNQPQVVNCIIWANNPQIGTASGNPLNYVEYCCVQGGYSGTSNISTPPLFVNPGDYHISYNSPCVNTGKPNSTDAGETDIDGDPRVINDVVDIGADEGECFPRDCHPDYDDWLLMGRPLCWCYSPYDRTRYQCDGDADGLTEGYPKYRVYTKDFNEVVKNWKKKITDPTLNPCADFDHKYEGAVTKYRIYTLDLAKIVANWKKKDIDLPGNCPRCGEAAKGQEAKAIDIDTLVKLLEEIWLDPQVQKIIDEKAWQKFIDSLEELASNYQK